MTRYVALIRDFTPLAGVCPACAGIMDDTGCLIGDHVVSREPARSCGVAQIVEVFCKGVPTFPVYECPC